jgi:hypothetical protein
MLICEIEVMFNVTVAKILACMCISITLMLGALTVTVLSLEQLDAHRAYCR